MTDSDTDVKQKAGALIRWIDRHPRTGWYVALIVTLNFLMHVGELLHLVG